MTIFRWGILGSGFAARKFVLGLRAARDAEAVLVASRSAQKAKGFAEGLGIAHAAGSYGDAVREEKVDAFYLATPPSTHREYALLCLNAGKPVLVEKPFALDAAAARDIVATARARSVFCMEGMWTRFVPLVKQVKRMVDEGVVGDVRIISGSFCTAEVRRPDNNLFNPGLGGGATLDRGVYLISLAFHILGKPDGISSETIVGETGVDEDVAAILRYDRGRLAIINASLRTQASNECVIMGTRAQIRIHAPIYRPFRMTVTPIHEIDRGGAHPSRFESIRESHWVHGAYQRVGRFAPGMLDRGAVQYAAYYAGNGYHHEAEEVMDCVRSGRLESTVMPLGESIGVMEVVDEIRSQRKDNR